MKQIHCFHCGEALEVHDAIVDGQHILCPYCNKKFSYSNVESDSNNTSSFGGKGKKLWLPIGVIAIGVVITVVKLHFYPSDETKLERLTTWYKSQLDYNGLWEPGYGVENEDDEIGCGEAFILGLRNDRDDKYIQWFPKTGQFIHPRSMAKGFAKDLLMTRIAIEELRVKLHLSKRRRKATLINLPEGLTEKEAEEYVRKMDEKERE